MRYKVHHSIFTGKAGSGKTTLISEQLAAAKAKNPLLKVCVIDVKACSKDSSLYQLADMHLVRQCRVDDPRGIVEFVLTALETFAGFAEKHSNTLLIIEEMQAIEYCFRRNMMHFYVANFVEGMVSFGDSKGQTIWLSCMDERGASNISSATKSQFRLFAL